MNGTASSGRTRKKDNEVKVCRGYMNKLGTIDTCTANVGGSIMIDQIKKNHSVNMMTMKKRVDNELPWSYRNIPANFNLNRRVSPLKKPKALSPLNTKDNRMATLSTQQNRGANTERSGSKSKLDLSKDSKIDPIQLLEDQEEQEIYEKFLDLLRSRKNIEDARKLASSVFLEAEEQMLLGAYSGVPQYVEGFISKEEDENQDSTEELDEDTTPHASSGKEDENEGNEKSFSTIEENNSNETVSPNEKLVAKENITEP